MGESYSMESLNHWRKFFTYANADMLHVIKFAILVASADCPSDFLSWRDQITEVLYNCYSMQQCSSEVDTQKESKETKSSDSSKENEHTISNGLTISGRDEHSNLDEFEALTNEIEEEQEIFGEVLRIKEILTNWNDESENTITDSLRRLQLMELTIETLSATQIGKTVSSLSKHKSKPVRQLAKTLVQGWKLLAEEWVTATLASQEPSPYSVDPSPAQEEECMLPSELAFPPIDVGTLLETQTGSFEFSKIFEGIDDDGNLTNNVRKNPTPKQVDDGSTRKEYGKNKEVAARSAAKPQEFTTRREPKQEKSPLQKATICSNSEQRQTPHQYPRERRKQEEATPKAPNPVDANRKASKPMDNSNVDISRNAKQRQNSSGATLKNEPSGKNKSKESEDLAYQAKLEVAKRKLQDRYEEANNAKRQRTIQVMELKDLPKAQSRSQPIMKRGNQFRRCMNMKS